MHAAGRVGGIQANIADPVGFLTENLDIGLSVILGAQAIDAVRAGAADDRVGELVRLAHGARRAAGPHRNSRPVRAPIRKTGRAPRA